MIVPLKARHGNEEYIVCPRAPATVSELHDRMLERAKVATGSYAYRLVEDMHSAIFLQSLDLKADYETYFALEYVSFAEYLRRRERTPANVEAILSKALEVSTGIYRFKPGYAFLSDTYGHDFLRALLDDPSEEEAH